MDALLNNPYLTAGAGMIGLGSMLALLKTGSVHAVQLARRKLLTTLEIPSHDQSYEWVLSYLANKTQLRESQHLSLSTSLHMSPSGSVSSNFTFIPGSKKDLRFNAFKTGQGNHIFKHANTYFHLSRTKAPEAPSFDTSSKPRETILLTSLTSSREPMTSLLDASRDEALRHLVGKTVIYTSVGTEWRQFGEPRRKRDFGTVVLKQGLAEKILSDVEKFRKGEAWYHQNGIPYRRGYLLHGPPYLPIYSNFNEHLEAQENLLLFKLWLRISTFLYPYYLFLKNI